MAAALSATPANWSGWNALKTASDSLAQLMAAQLWQASGQVASQSAATFSANDAINCIAQPCIYERYLHGLYLSTRVLTPRVLSVAEITAIHDIGVQCPAEAGSAVYTARSWYYLLTGKILHDTCGLTQFSGTSQRVSANKVLQTATMLAVPNPADQSVQFTLPVHAGAVMLTVRNMLGKTMLQQSFAADQPSAQVSLAQWPAGCYAAMLTDESGKPLAAARLVVAH